MDKLNVEPGVKLNFGSDSLLEQEVYIRDFSFDPDKIYLFSNHRSGRIYSRGVVFFDTMLRR